MGLEDREYLREEALRYGGGGGGGRYGGTAGGGRWRMVTWIVFITLILFIIDAFSPPIVEPGHPAGNQFFDSLALKTDEVFSGEILKAPWNVYQLLSYGFAHASMSTSRGIFHVVLNMFVLWQLGRMVEDRYGRNEFLYFYLIAIVFSGLVYGIWNLGQTAAVVGASGAVSAAVILFALSFPHHKVYLYGIWAIPGWLLGVLFVGYEFVTALTNGNDRIAHESHLAGAAFGAAYFYMKIKLENYVPTEWLGKLFSRQPNLTVHHPDDDDEAIDPALQREEELADEVLDKLHREGEESLTRKERKILERYSKRIRSKR